jgi:hypothetical protein
VAVDAVTPRIVRAEDLGGFTAGQLLEVVEAVMMILALPRSAAGRVDAIAVMSGQGEQWRLTQAIRDWESDPRLRHLLVASGNPAEKTYVGITLDYLRGLGLRRVEGVCVQPEPAGNTAGQAAWIVEHGRSHRIGGIALTVSPYHLPRAYLTVLKELDRAGVRLPMIPVPVAIAPHLPVPETGATAYELVPGEAHRILSYVKNGWVASPQELRDYLRWLWDHLGAAPAVQERGQQ